ncbi:MAG TPA: hypothetical protein VLH38_05585 [Patescibacteria group bacterium]|nr:hypothetical protein [Patescibacteria group bacterium]
MSLVGANVQQSAGFKAFPPANLLQIDQTNTRKLGLHSVDWMTYIAVLAAIGAGLASIVSPLLRNIRGSPVKDMRDE